MNERSFENPQTRERATLVESARETGGKRSVLDIEVGGGGGVMGHFHDVHQERIEVLAGAHRGDHRRRQLTRSGRARRSSSSPAVAPVRGTLPRRSCCGFAARSPRATPASRRRSRCCSGSRATARRGRNGFPKRLGDTRLAGEVERGLPTGPARLLAPVFGWLARRAEASGRAAELLRRYGVEAPASGVRPGSRDAAPRRPREEPSCTLADAVPGPPSGDAVKGADGPARPEQPHGEGRDRGVPAG